MNYTIYDSSHPANLILSITAGTVGAIGLPGNLFLMILILSEYKKRKPHEWLIFTLTFGDFFLCFNNAFFEAPFILNPTRFECKVAGTMDYFFGTVSFLTPPIVAYNRYLSLYNAPKYSRIFTTRNIFLAWGLVMVFSLFWMSPFLISGNLGLDDLGLCGTLIRNDLLAAAMCTVVAVVLISYGFVLYFSYKVVVKIRNHKRSAVTKSQLQSRLIDEAREIITVMLILSIVPFFAQVPAAVVKVVHIFVPHLNPWMVRVLTAPFPTTSAINSYVTIFVVKDYRKKTIKLFKKSRARVGAISASIP